MKLMLINGPNINMLGIREVDIYGQESYRNLMERVEKKAGALDIQVDCFQSNYEGAIIDKIQEAYLKKYHGIIINPAGYTHTSVSILDALKAVSLPTVEVHISSIEKREAFRHVSYPSLYCEKIIAGKGLEGYEEAIEYLYRKYKKKR